MWTIRPRWQPTPSPPTGYVGSSAGFGLVGIDANATATDAGTSATLTDYASAGLLVADAAMTATGTDVSGTSEAGLYCQSGTLQFSEGSISDFTGGYGAYLYYCDASFDDVEISDGAGSGIYAQDSDLDLAELQVTGLTSGTGAVVAYAYSSPVALSLTDSSLTSNATTAGVYVYNYAAGTEVLANAVDVEGDDYGTVTVGAMASVTLSIRNEGTAPLKVRDAIFDKVIWPVIKKPVKEMDEQPEEEAEPGS